jgi:hypothetical protein
LGVGHIAAVAFCAGFVRNFLGSCMIFFIEEADPVTLGSEQLYCRRANAPAAAGDYNC